MRFPIYIALFVFAPTICVAQESKSVFTDVTAETGIRVNVEKRPKQPEYGIQMPHGVAVEDFDGDGLFDIILVCFGKPYVQLFRNEGGLRFSDVTKGSGLEIFEGWGTGAAVADFDRDGQLDVYLTSVQFERSDQTKSPPGKESRLFKGLGNGKFRDVSSQSGTLLNKPARCCAWNDIDGDGWVDLFIACPQCPNALFRNNGDGTFTDIAERAGVTNGTQYSLGCAFGDIDNDGLDDLFVANYSSQSSVLLRNLGTGKFKEVTSQIGVDRKAASVGCVFADVLNRGRLDLYVTTDSWLSGANSTEEQLLKQGHTVEPNALYMNGKKGKFSMSPVQTLAHKTLSHDAVLEDFNHDGLIDIYVGVDAIPTGNKFATNKGGNPMWTRNDGKTWEEVRSRWGVGFEGNCVCVPAADFDNDGDLDLLLVNFYKNIVLYRNNTDNKNWLRVKPVGKKSNPDGIGARVSLFSAEKGKKVLLSTRYIQSGAGYGRSSPLEAHFGLGQNLKKNYRIEVIFPGSKSPVIRENVEPGQQLRVQQMTD